MVAVLGWLLLVPALQYESITLETMRPSVFIARYADAFEGFEFRADDDHGKLYFRGPSDALDQVRTYANLFEVVPRRVRIKLDYDSDIDRRGGKAELEATHSQWIKFSDAGIKLDAEFAPRINDDNSITLYAKFKYENRLREFVVRIPHRQPRTLYLMRKGPYYQWEPPKKVEPGLRSLPVIQMELTVLDN